MQCTNLAVTCFVFLLFCRVVALDASEANELRERAKSMRKEAAALAERGNTEQAERLERESLNLLEAAERMELKVKAREEGDRPSIDNEVQRLKEWLHKLLAAERKLREANASGKELAEVREQIAGTEQELQTIQAHHVGQVKLPIEFHAQAEKLEAASRRIHHLRVAAENLKMAEAHDLAKQLMEKAEAMEREVQAGKQQLAAEIQKVHGREQGPDVVRELKEEIQRLRAEVKELRQKVEQR